MSEFSADSRLDNLHLVETPEGIDLEAELAGPVARILAYVLDFLIRYFILAILAIVLAMMGKAGWGIWLIVSFFLEWWYPVLFEVLRNGQTPGKRAFDIRVVNENLTPVTWSSSLTRNLLRAADFLPFAFLLGVICMSLNKRFQRLGDMAAGTLVVYQKQQEDGKVLPESSPIAPPFPLSEDEQVAIICLYPKTR